MYIYKFLQQSLMIDKLFFIDVTQNKCLFILEINQGELSMTKRAKITADKLEAFISASTLMCHKIEKDMTQPPKTGPFYKLGFGVLL